MVIRCEKCSTLYELDEALLSPDGSPVQCTRCQHVFTARLAQAPARAPARVSAGPRPAPAPAAEPPAPPAPPPASGMRPEGPRAPASDLPRGPRPGGPAVYRPPPGQGIVPRAPVISRNTLGTFESRLRWAARWKWLAPTLVVVVVAAAAGGWVLLSRRADPTAAQLRAEAIALVALDDGSSVERGVTRFGDALQRAPRLAAAVADRALAQVVRATALVEEGEPLARRAAAHFAERERLRREQPPGWAEAEHLAGAEAEALATQVRTRADAARQLSAAAFETLHRLESDGEAAVEVARAFASYYALGNDRTQVERVVSGARGADASDPWLALAVASLDARSPERALRERAVVRLGALTARHPEILRGRYLLARTQAALGRRAEALAVVDRLLAANARHEGAKALRAELSRPSPAPSPPPQEALPPTVAGKSVPLSRKPVALPAPVAGASGAGGAGVIDGALTAGTAPGSLPAAVPVPPPALPYPSGATGSPTLVPAASLVPSAPVPAAVPVGPAARRGSWPSAEEGDLQPEGG